MWKFCRDYWHQVKLFCHTQITLCVSSNCKWYCEIEQRANRLTEGNLWWLNIGSKIEKYDSYTERNVWIVPEKRKLYMHCPSAVWTQWYRIRNGKMCRNIWINNGKHIQFASIETVSRSGIFTPFYLFYYSFDSVAPSIADGKCTGKKYARVTINVYRIVERVLTEQKFLYTYFNGLRMGRANWNSTWENRASFRLVVPIYRRFQRHAGRELCMIFLFELQSFL